MKGGGGETRPGLRSASQKSGKIKFKNMKTRCEYVFIELKEALKIYLAESDLKIMQRIGSPPD